MRKALAIVALGISVIATALAGGSPFEASTGDAPEVSEQAGITDVLLRGSEWG